MSAHLSALRPRAGPAVLKGILCLELTVLIPLVALAVWALSWALELSPGRPLAITKIQRCLETAIGGALANVPVGAAMGLCAWRIRRLRFLAIALVGVSAALLELGVVLALPALPLALQASLLIWFLWALYGGASALVPAAWLLARWTRVRVADTE